MSGTVRRGFMGAFKSKINCGADFELYPTEKRKGRAGRFLFAIVHNRLFRMVLEVGDDPLSRG
jgi:hypothetical protein